MLLRLGGQRGIEVGRRADDLVADAVELGAGDDRVRRGLAARRAGHQRGELAAEVDELLGEHLDAGPGSRRERLRGLVPRSRTDPDAPAVVPAAGDLEHAREPNASTSASEVDDGVPRAGHPELVSRARITALSWACTSASGPGRTATPASAQRVQVLGRHVLVVERDDPCPAGDLAQHLEVAVVTDERVGDDLGRRDALGLGQQPQRDPQRRGRLGHHPRELPAADHGDGGREVGHGATLECRDSRQRAAAAVARGPAPGNGGRPGEPARGRES